MAYKSQFGTCDKCNCDFEADYFEADYFEAKETKLCGGVLIPTEKVRTAVNCLYCSICMKDFCCNDSFDGPWHKK